MRIMRGVMIMDFVLLLFITLSVVGFVFGWRKRFACSIFEDIKTIFVVFHFTVIETGKKSFLGFR
jgi:hypothetical protein